MYYNTHTGGVYHDVGVPEHIVVIQTPRYTILPAMEKDHLLSPQCILASVAVSLFFCGCAVDSGTIELVDYHVHLKGGLAPRDMFTPKPDGKKAIQLKKLPKLKY